MTREVCFEAFSGGRRCTCPLGALRGLNVSLARPAIVVLEDPHQRHQVDGWRTARLTCRAPKVRPAIHEPRVIEQVGSHTAETVQSLTAVSWEQPWFHRAQSHVDWPALLHERQQPQQRRSRHDGLAVPHRGKNSDAASSYSHCLVPLQSLRLFLRGGMRELLVLGSTSHGKMLETRASAAFLLEATRMPAAVPHSLELCATHGLEHWLLTLPGCRPVIPEVSAVGGTIVRAEWVAGDLGSCFNPAWEVTVHISGQQTYLLCQALGVVTTCIGFLPLGILPPQSGAIASVRLSCLDETDAPSHVGLTPRYLPFGKLPDVFRQVFYFLEVVVYFPACFAGLCGLAVCLIMWSCYVCSLVQPSKPGFSLHKSNRPE